MKLGDRILSRGMSGADVAELQIRLSGFRGTVWDGDFGPGTELQAVTFQKDYMHITSPTGAIDAATISALETFAQQFPVTLGPLECECGHCGGFGQGRFKGEYEAGMPKTEAYHRYEYPGIHKAILHAFRGLWFYAQKAGFGPPLYTCGYRCWLRNEQKQRTTKNHMGKAIDIDFALNDGEGKREDLDRCNRVRGLLVEKSNFQIGWGAANHKSLEPSDIAPTWVHMDVRCFGPNFLEDKYFVKKEEELNSMEV